MIGDGAIGFSAVAEAMAMGASRMTLLGGQQARTDLGREFGSTGVVAERGDAAIAGVCS
ncbi:hypothetical protein ITJ38_03380 [Agreia pratensis]|uniref:hypothetical protein n=1 Tax=Agreia pratensis TaxID=150121 RepID=UPI00188ADAB3|nr:hypothetical protein [Agreia pratensis]MBF4633440.1 hypothetical protein [Agreia pratensis]